MAEFSGAQVSPPRMTGREVAALVLVLLGAVTVVGSVLALWGVEAAALAVGVLVLVVGVLLGLG